MIPFIRGGSFLGNGWLLVPYVLPINFFRQYFMFDTSVLVNFLFLTLSIFRKNEKF